jgi:ATP-dependent Clp protease ATP-binding subunit ClpX
VASVPPQEAQTSPPRVSAVDTTNILFICGGAFHGLEKIIERRISKRTMGFEAQLYT